VTCDHSRSKLISRPTININYQHQLSTPIINTNYQHQLSTPIINTNYQHQLSTPTIIPLCRFISILLLSFSHFYFIILRGCFQIGHLPLCSLRFHICSYPTFLHITLYHLYIVITFFLTTRLLISYFFILL
jgi:hypothetical protein